MKYGLILGLCIMIIIVGCFKGCGSYYKKDTIVTTIIHTEVKQDKNNSRYLIFATDEVYENTDCWVYGKFRSSNLQTKILQLVGKKVKITKYGWRIPILSWYENILSIEEVE